MEARYRSRRASVGYDSGLSPLLVLMAFKLLPRNLTDSAELQYGHNQCHFLRPFSKGASHESPDVLPLSPATPVEEMDGIFLGIELLSAKLVVELNPELTQTSPPDVYIINFKF